MLKKYLKLNYKSIITEIIVYNSILFLFAFFINKYSNYSIDDYIAFLEGVNIMLIILQIINYRRWLHQNN
ncbi:hypothetical protein GCM10022410_22230 [Amphibacillus indicireducens]|uniref:Uncharacterized protein n=1 Tax=Amphibacillus indicireducens TaxID=1076330 RepID=A0ABP7VYA2_9BACI